MSERDLLQALRGTIDGPVAPENAFAEELRARLLTELAANRPPAIAEERVMEITTPGLPQSFPIPRPRRLPSWRRLTEIAAIAVILIGLLAVFTSERAGSPPPKATMPAVQGINPSTQATPQPQSEQGALLWQSPYLTERNVPAESQYAVQWPVALAKGMIYRFQSDGDFFGVEAIDAATGEMRWQTAMSGFESGIAADASGVYVTRAFTIQMPTPEPGPIHTVTALDPATGDVRWAINTGSGQKTPVVRDGVLYVQEGGSVGNANGGTSETVTAIDTSDGTVRWDTVIDIQGLGFATGDQLAGHSLVVGDNIVVALSGRGGITALDRKTGERLWTKAQYFTNQTDLAIAGDRVVVSSPANSTLFPTLKTKFAVMAFNAADGAPLWARDLGDKPSSLAVTKDVVVVVGEGYLFAPEGSPASTSTPNFTSWASIGLKLDTGAIAWYGPGGEGDDRPPVPVALDDGSYVLLALGYGSYTLIDAANGNTQNGSVLLGQNISGSPVSDGERIYIPLENGTIVAVRLERPGAENASLSAQATPAVSDFERDLGVFWSIPKSEGTTNVVAITSSRNTVYFLEAQEVVAVDSATGTVLWRSPISLGWGIYADPQGVYVITTPSESDYSGTLRKLSWQTGEEVWSVPVGVVAGNPVLYQGMILIWDAANTLHALSAASGVEIWQRDYSQTAMTAEQVDQYIARNVRPPMSLLDGDALIVGTSDGRVGSINLASETHDWNWSASVDSGAEIRFQIAIASGVVAAAAIHAEDVPSPGSNLIAWDIATGEELWRGDSQSTYGRLLATESAFITAQIPLVDGTPAAAASPLDSPLFMTVALDPRTGTERWHADRFTPIAISADGGMLIAISPHVHVAAIDMQTGAVLGSLYPAGFISSVAITDETALYGFRGDGSLIAIKLASLRNGSLEGAPIVTPEASPEATPNTSASA